MTSSTRTAIVPSSVTCVTGTAADVFGGIAPQQDASVCTALGLPNPDFTDPLTYLQS